MLESDRNALRAWLDSCGEMTGDVAATMHRLLMAYNVGPRLSHVAPTLDVMIPPSAICGLGEPYPLDPVSVPAPIDGHEALPAREPLQQHNIAKGQ